MRSGETHAKAVEHLSRKKYIDIWTSANTICVYILLYNVCVYTRI